MAIDNKNAPLKSIQTHCFRQENLTNFLTTLGLCFKWLSLALFITFFFYNCHVDSGLVSYHKVLFFTIWYAAIRTLVKGLLANNNEETKGQLNSEWIYEVIISPKMLIKNYKDFCPTKQTRIVAKKTAYTHQEITKKSAMILVCLVGQKFL